MMDILKELQLFDDAPNDGEINTLLGQRTLTLHRSKSTEDLHSLEDRHSLDIYRASFPTSAVFTGASTAVLSGDSHGGIRAAGVLFTTVEAPVPDMDLSCVSHEMPMCLLQEDEGNEEELLRLLSGQGGKEWLLQEAACADHGGASVETDKDGAGVTWCSDAGEGLLGDASIMLPDDLHLLVGAPAMSALDFQHLQEPAGEMAPAGVDKPNSLSATTAQQEATIQDQLLQELASHISDSGIVTRDMLHTMTSVASECELSAVLEATGVPMMSSSLPSSRAPQASSHQTAGMQCVPPSLQYTISSPSLAMPSPPPLRPLTSSQPTSPSLRLSLLHTSPQQPVAGCNFQTSVLPQTATHPQDLAGTIFLNDILAAAVALCTSAAQSTEPVQSIHAASQAETSGCSQLQLHKEGIAGTQTSSASSRWISSTSLTSSRQASATSLASSKQTSATGLTTARQTVDTSSTPLRSITAAGSVPSRQTSAATLARARPTSVASSGILVGASSVSTRHSALPAYELASDRAMLKASTVQGVASSSPIPGASQSSPSTPALYLDHTLAMPTSEEQQQDGATAGRRHVVSASSAPCTPVPLTTEEDEPLSAGSMVPVCSGGRGISLHFPMVDWTSRRVLQERVVPMSAMRIKLLPSEPQTSGGDMPTGSEPKPKRKHSGGWSKGKKRKTVASLLPPKPPVTATKLTEELGTLSMSSLSKQLGIMWSALDDKRKLEYREKADGDRKRYLCELKVYLRKVHQATAEDHMGTLEMFVSENVTQEEDDDLLFCQICKLTFASLHNKKTHYSGKLHMEALLQCIKEAMANQAENQTAKPDTRQTTDPESQLDDNGVGSRSDGQKGDMNDNTGDRSGDQLEGTNAQIDCSNSQHSMHNGTVNSERMDGDGQTAGLDSQHLENNEVTDSVKGDCFMNGVESDPLDIRTNGPEEQSGCGHHDSSSNRGHPMEEGEVVTCANVGGQGGCEGIDLCRRQSSATDCRGIQVVHRYPGGRRRPNKRGGKDSRPRPVVAQQSAVSLGDPSSVPGQSVPQQQQHQMPCKAPCADTTKALEGVVSEHPLQQGAAGLYSTITKQMADFAITYSCCVNSKNGGNASSPSGCMHPNDRHNNSLVALRERAMRLKDSITSLLEILENVQ